MFGRASINWIDEIQHTTASGLSEDLSHDRLTSLRVGASFSGCYAACIGLDIEASKGLEIGSRSNSQVGNGTPLSRSSATSNYTHFRVNGNVAGSPAKDMVLKVNAGGQYTLDDLLNSEQTGITGEDKVSAFTSGSITGDEAWYVRGQVNQNIKLGNNLVFSPYFYSAMGVAYVNQPTATERASTTGKSVGIGLEVSGGDDYFFNKTISAKVEISKSWATSNIEDVSDVRLNKRHMLVTMAMRF